MPRRVRVGYAPEMRAGVTICAMLGLLCSGFVPPKRALSDIVGQYRAVGAHPDGSAYEGKGTITRLSADRYEIRFDMPNGVFRALCLRDRDVLGCAWGSVRTLTVAIFRPAPGGLEVTHAHDGDTTTVREMAPLVRTTPQGAFHRVEWEKAEPLSGFGLHVGSMLVAAFPRNDAGAAFYRILPGGQLVGEWMDPNQSSDAVGNETLTR